MCALVSTPLSRRGRETKKWLSLRLESLKLDLRHSARTHFLAPLALSLAPKVNVRPLAHCDLRRPLSRFASVGTLGHFSRPDSFLSRLRQPRKRLKKTNQLASRDTAGELRVYVCQNNKRDLQAGQSARGARHFLGAAPVPESVRASGPLARSFSSSGLVDRIWDSGAVSLILIELAHLD